MNEIAIIGIVLAPAIPSALATLVLLRINRKLDAMTAAVHEAEVGESRALGVLRATHDWI